MSTHVHVLALNVGSSSLKYDLLLVVDGKARAKHVSGTISDFVRRAHVRETIGSFPTKTARANVDSIESAVVLAILRAGAIAEELELPIDCVAHRIVHGGAAFPKPVILRSRELRELEKLIPYAPLHQPVALRAVRACARAYGPKMPQIGVFDTAFHATLPEAAWRYPIPRALADRHGLRRFGFHGLAFESVMRQLPELVGRPRKRISAVLLHLGSGASAAAIRDGASIDTTMGLTPLEGLMMRTRSGTIDPALSLLLARAAKLTPDAVIDMLWRESGLAGIAGGDGDVRDLLTRERTDPHARLALEMFTRSVKKQLGAYLALLGKVDAIAFSGGIGENAHALRQRVLTGLESLGIHVDPSRNRDPSRGDRRITSRSSKVPVFVIAANEGNVMAELAAEAVR